MQERPVTRPEDDAQEQVRNAVHETATSAKDEAAQLGAEAKEAVAAQAEHARREAASFAEEQRHAAADSIAAVAAALQAGVHSLEADGQPAMAGYWRTAAEGMDDFARRIQNKPAGEALSEAEQYVREQPGLGFGGAMVAGFMLARFLKSSTPAPQPGTTPQTRQPRDPYQRPPMASGTPTY